MKIKSGIFMLSVFCGFVGQAFALSDENRPEYQKEYDAYLQDLEVIAQTGKAPANPDLEADLAKMSSNDRILLTAPAVVSSEEFLVQNDARIINKVEIIHVPEEFQEEYADLYKEEKGILGTPSLAEDEKKLSDKEAKVSEHQNPFQNKDAVKNEDNVFENAAVNAYFNPFSQTYVSDTKPSNSSASKTVSNNSSSSASTISSSPSKERGTSSKTSSYAKRNRKLTSSPMGVKKSMFVR